VERLGGRHYTHPVHSKNPLTILKNAFWLARFIRDRHVNVVHARSRAPAWSVWMASRMTQRPFVTTVHAAYKFSTKIKKFYNSVMARGDRIVAISPYIAHQITRAYSVDVKKIRIVNRGIDLERFSPDNVSEERREALRKAWNVKKGQKIVLMPARVSPIKGHTLLIEAIAHLPHNDGQTVAVLLGDDQGRHGYRRELEALIRSSGLQNEVRMVDHCNDMPAAYSLATVAVAPSRFPEGFGRVPVEAMAMGVPVIASDLGAMHDTVRDGETGWLLPPSNPRVWAEAIARALALTPEERADMAKDAMLRAHASYDLRRMVIDTLAVYDELAGEAA
jgi:glycosyltransferase involved in cell wall biosynthesis